MRTRLIVLVCVLLLALVSPAFAQTQVTSAAVAGVGGVWAAWNDDPSLISVNASLLQLSYFDAAINLSYRQPFALSELEETAISGAVRAGERFVIGGSLQDFGDPDLYTELTIHVATAWRSTRWTAVGASLALRRNSFGPPSGSTSSATRDYEGVTVGLHGAWLPNRHWRVGAAVYDITLNALYDSNDIPTVYDISAAWLLPPDLTIAGRWFTGAGGRSRFAVGQILRVLSSQEVFITSGLRFDPVRFSLGGRFATRSLTIDYAYESHPDLGGTHTVGLGFRW